MRELPASGAIPLRRTGPIDASSTLDAGRAN
jgi:hypothetical protein